MLDRPIIDGITDNDVPLNYFEILESDNNSENNNHNLKVIDLESPTHDDNKTN